MRLWPTTPMLSRETVRNTDWDGVPIPAGTQLVIVNSFTHRDREQFAFADKFEPDQWLSGEASDDWSFNHFSHGPQGCPGTALAMFVGKAVIGHVLVTSDLRLLEPDLDPRGALPHALDYFSLRFDLRARR
jgi:cytochrome P450